MSSPRSLSNMVPARIAPTDTTTPVKRPYSDARSVSQSPTHDHGESGHHTRRTNYESRSWSDHDTFASKYEIVGNMESPEWAMKIKFKSPLPYYVKGGVKFGFFVGFVANITPVQAKNVRGLRFRVSITTSKHFCATKVLIFIETIVKMTIAQTILTP